MSATGPWWAEEAGDTSKSQEGGGKITRERERTCQETRYSIVEKKALASLAAAVGVPDDGSFAAEMTGRTQEARAVRNSRATAFIFRGATAKRACDARRGADERGRLPPVVAEILRERDRKGSTPARPWQLGESAAGREWCPGSVRAAAGSNQLTIAGGR